jgi:hypothetical protein
MKRIVAYGIGGLLLGFWVGCPPFINFGRLIINFDYNVFGAAIGLCLGMCFGLAMQRLADRSRKSG